MATILTNLKVKSAAPKLRNAFKNAASGLVVEYYNLLPKETVPTPEQVNETVEKVAYLLDKGRWMLGNDVRSPLQSSTNHSQSLIYREM